MHRTVSESESLATYWTFYRAVAAAQLSRWLPRHPSRILDISDAGARCVTRAAAAGHTVLRVHPPGAERTAATPRVHPLVADPGRLRFLTEGCVDAVVADGRVLSRHLVTEELVAETARVLRPGGRLLACVDSLVLGMALLAEQNRWAQLSDVPRAEVVLIPWPDGSMTRCFGTEQLRELLEDGGFEVEWVRSRTALSPSTVEHVLGAAPQALARLVRAELNAPVNVESVGIHLVVSARRR